MAEITFAVFHRTVRVSMPAIDQADGDPGYLMGDVRERLRQQDREVLARVDRDLTRRLLRQLGAP